MNNQIQMNYKELKIQSKDNTQLFCRCFEPKTDFKQALLIVHGFGEHSGRYEEIAKFLIQNQYAVYAYDHRGHGHSGGKKGHSPSYAHYLDDLQTVYEHIQKHSGKGVQLHLMGHSMGGNIAGNFIMRYNNKFHKVILSSPWIELAFEPPAYLVFFGKLIKKIYPKFTQATNLDVNALSKIPEEIKKYKEDSLVHDRITATTYFGIYDAGKYILENPQNIKNPVLLIHGGEDKITSFSASRKLASLNPDQISFKPFQHGYHEVHHDSEKEEFYKAVLEFLRN